jgi:hypothetical protein
MIRSKLAPWIPVVLVTVLPLLLLQCTSTPPPSNGVEEKIAEGVAQGWTRHILAQDAASAMTLVEPAFTSDSFPSRADLDAYLRTAAARGYFAGGTSDFSIAKTVIKRRKATVYPIRLHTPAGSYQIGLHLSRNGRGWLVSGLDWELY